MPSLTIGFTSGKSKLETDIYTLAQPKRKRQPTLQLPKTAHFHSMYSADIFRPNSLQLNIGIIAACASFLKPMFGRILKINSSAGYYPSGSRQYNRSGHTPLDAGATGSNAYATHNRRRVTTDRTLDDEFELHSKNSIRVTDQEVVTTVRATRSQTTSDDNFSALDGPHSDTNSEEIILQGREHGRGIVCKTDFSVEYSHK